MIQAFGNEIYGKVALEVGKETPYREVISDLKAAQKKIRHPFISAKHIGLNIQVFSVDLSFSKPQSSDFHAVFIKPEIIAKKAPLVSQLEDDLSIPRLSVSIERPKQIEVSFLDEEFNEQKAVFSDIAARWIMHGVEQLNGKSMIDCLNKHRKRSIKGHLRKLSEKKIETHYKLEYDT